MTSSRPTLQGRKQAVAAAMRPQIGRFPTAPDIVDEAKSDPGGDIVQCLYVNAWVGDECIPLTLADTGAGGRIDQS
jgi:hypothetical protein